MTMLAKIVLTIAGSLATFAALGWAGLQVAPQNFPTPTVKPLSTC